MAENRLCLLDQEAQKSASPSSRAGDRPSSFDALSSSPPVTSFFFEQLWSLPKLKADTSFVSSSGPILFFFFCVFAPWESMRAYLAAQGVVPTLPWLTAWNALLAQPSGM